MGADVGNAVAKGGDPVDSSFAPADLMLAIGLTAGRLGVSVDVAQLLVQEVQTAGRPTELIASLAVLRWQSDADLQGRLIVEAGGDKKSDVGPELIEAGYGGGAPPDGPRPNKSSVPDHTDDGAGVPGTDDGAVLGTDDGAAVPGTEDGPAVPGTEDGAGVPGPEDGVVPGTDDGAVVFLPGTDAEAPGLEDGAVPGSSGGSSSEPPGTLLPGNDKRDPEDPGGAGVDVLVDPSVAAKAEEDKGLKKRPTNDVLDEAGEVVGETSAKRAKNTSGADEKDCSVGANDLGGIEEEMQPVDQMDDFDDGDGLGGFGDIGTAVSSGVVVSPVPHDFIFNPNANPSSSSGLFGVPKAPPKPTAPAAGSSSHDHEMVDANVSASGAAAGSSSGAAGPPAANKEAPAKKPGQSVKPTKKAEQSTNPGVKKDTKKPAPKKAAAKPAKASSAKASPKTVTDEVILSAEGPTVFAETGSGPIVQRALKLGAANINDWGTICANSELGGAQRDSENPLLPQIISLPLADAISRAEDEGDSFHARFSVPVSVLQRRSRDAMLRGKKTRHTDNMNLIVDHDALRWLNDPHDVSLELAQVISSKLCSESHRASVIFMQNSQCAEVVVSH